MTRLPKAGDAVRIRSTPETEAAGFAGKRGMCDGFTTPSVTGIKVIGTPKDDCALSVLFEADGDKSVWFAAELVEPADLDRRSEAVTEVLLTDWYPRAGVDYADCSAPVARLLAAGCGPEMIAGYLLYLEKEWLKLIPDPERTRSAARRLVNLGLGSARPDACRFWYGDSHGLIRRREKGGLYVGLETWRDGRWQTAGPYALDAITGMGEDPHSCGEWAQEWDALKTLDYAESRGIDLFAETDDQPKGIGAFLVGFLDAFLRTQRRR